MIEAVERFPPNIVAFAWKERVTRSDYEAVLVPVVKYEIGPEIVGFFPGTMWGDFEISVEYLTRWEKVAVVTDVAWIGHTIHAFSFLTPGDMMVFPTAQAAEARRWIVAVVP
jgi:hypothetical protein